MVHVELSLSAAEAPPDSVPPLRVLNRPRALRLWLDALTEAEDSCLVLDPDGIVLGVSPACVELFGAASVEELVGCGLLDGVIDAVDFTAVRDKLADAQLERLPPLLALSSGALARGLVRIRTSAGIRTLDAISTPLHLQGALTGSLTFFHRV